MQGQPSVPLKALHIPCRSFTEPPCASWLHTFGEPVGGQGHCSLVGFLFDQLKTLAIGVPLATQPLDLGKTLDKWLQLLVVRD